MSQLQFDEIFFTIPSPHNSTSAIKIQAKIYTPSTADAENPTFLLLPYWGGSSSTYEQVQTLAALSLLQNPSIALSHRGTGRSTAPDPDRTYAHGIDSLASDVRHLISSSSFQAFVPSKKLVICAHSMSAKVIWRLLGDLATEGKTFQSETRLVLSGLLLLAPAPASSLLLPDDLRDNALRGYDSVEAASWTLAHVLIKNGNLSSDSILSMAEQSAAYSKGAKRGWVELGMSQDLSEGLRRVGATNPSLFVHILVGIEDKVETLELVQSKTISVLDTAGFQVKVSKVEDCGHLIPVEKPQVVVDALDWLLVATNDRDS